MPEFVDQLCLAARSHDASDIFLHEGRIPQVRLNGQLMEFGEAPLKAEDLTEFWEACGGNKETLDLDTSFVSSDKGRYRVNLFQSLGKRGSVMRLIKTDIPAIESLGIPAHLMAEWIGRPSGIVLVTGPTGSGKSTTLASSLEWMNENMARHVVTIEDPIEYLFESKNSLFTQREVGADTASFRDGLRQSLRQNPDVILLGEIRDSLTAMTALQASETGHLVLATLHSSTAPETIERLSRLFQPEEREPAHALLANQLVGILCQRLTTSAAGGLAVICEHFENTGASRKWILEGRFKELADFIEKGDNANNCSFLTSLVAAAKSGLITEEMGQSMASNPQEFSRAMRGISSGSGSRR